MFLFLQNAFHTTQNEEEEEGGGVSGTLVRFTSVSEVHGLNIRLFFGTENTNRKTLCGEHGDKTRQKSTGRVINNTACVLHLIELRNICMIPSE